jgi:non-ribosomal peptide synthetase component F
MQATPTTWRMLIESGWQGKGDLKILCGGEILPSGLARQLLPRCRELWNMYGPTETTIWSATEKITSPDHLSIGPPIANTQLYVVDESLQPVPAGASGELLIGGEGLAQGYLHQAELTAKRFIPDTFRSPTCQRIRTKSGSSASMTLSHAKWLHHFSCQADLCSVRKLFC